MEQIPYLRVYGIAYSITCARSFVTLAMLKLLLHISMKIIWPVSPCLKIRFVASSPVTLISAITLFVI